MENLSNILRIRVTPSMLGTIHTVSKQTGYKPSTIVRVCIASVFEPNSERSQVAVKHLKQAVKGKK